jgi:GTPase
VKSGSPVRRTGTRPSGRLRPDPKLPVVAIVGRTNVGKSTLFNRILRRGEAIVDDAPGVTRDRKAAVAEWLGREFMIVDTGGYAPRGKDAIDAGVSRQVRTALAEADCAVFVLDVTTGITDVDDEIARMLRKAGRPCVVAVNKVDNVRRELDAAEFNRLGLGEPMSISAVNGLGIGDLLSKIGELFGAAETAPDPEAGAEEAVRLAVVGRPNTGKSTFVNAALGSERMLVTEIPGTTRDAVDVRLHRQEHDFILVDTAGMRRRSRVEDGVEYYSLLRTQRALEACEAACVMTDAGEGLTQQDLQVVRQAVDGRKAVVLVFNKWDLLEKDDDLRNRIEAGAALKLRGLEYIPVLRVSCARGTGVGRILAAAWKAAQERRKRIASPELNRFLETLNERYQPPAVQGKRVRIVYATQAGARPPVFAFFSNHPELVHESYRKFLENQIRERFGFEGVPLTFSFRKK